MTQSSLKIEDEAAAAVAKTPHRVTLADIEGKIVTEQFVTSCDIDAITGVTSPQPGVLTICVLTLANGFTVTGESACADPANFNKALGQKIARDNAVRKVWGLEGYALRERLSQSGEA